MERYSNVSDVLADLAGLSVGNQSLPSLRLPSVHPVARETRNSINLSFTDCDTNDAVLDILDAASRASRATGAHVTLHFDGVRFGRNNDRSGIRTLDLDRPATRLELSAMNRIKELQEFTERHWMDAEVSTLLCAVEELRTLSARLPDPLADELLDATDYWKAMLFARQGWERKDYPMALRFAEHALYLRPASQGVRRMVDACREMLELRR